MPGFRLHSLALAAALTAGSAQAIVTVDGAVNVWPGGASVGPGDTDLGNVGLFVGNGAFGSLGVDGGSLLRSGSLLVGPSGSGNGNGAAVITGSGTRLELIGDGFADGVINRLGVGEWGRGSLTVSGGAVLDGRANAAACVGLYHYCNNFIGNAAGSDGTFTITGSGSQASFLRGFYVGGLAVFHPPVDGNTFGTPGGVTTGRVNVLAGGSLVTDNATLGLAPGGGSPTGTERSFAEATIAGPGSIWRVSGGTVEASAAFVETATHANAWATLTIRDGGTLRIEGDGNAYTWLHLTNNGGRTDARVTGAGSSVAFANQSGVLQVGRRLGSAVLSVDGGALVDNVWYTSVGRDGSFGTLNIDGSGTLYRANGTATAAANGSSGVAVFDIGRGGGTGVVNVGNGARLELLATTATAGAPNFSLGRDAASSGTLNIASGGTVLLRADSVAPDTDGEAWNPFLRVGRDGQGTLTINGGGKLLVQGNAVSTPTHTRSTNIYIGGSGSTSNGGRGIARIAGIGSEMQVSGSDAYIGVGHGPLAAGQLTVSDQATVAATILGVGNFGGTGVMRLDNASAVLTGQYSGQSRQGAALVVGAGSGAVGNLSAVNGSVITLANPGANGGGVTIGGSRSVSGGDGVMSLSASTLTLNYAATENTGISVGRSGSGLLRLQNGSTVDLGGSRLVVGAESGSDGTLIASGGSSILNAGWVGVGRAKASGGGDVDGGTGTMVLNSASLWAQDVVIGTNGYLGGSAGSIHVSGSVVNHGTFSPGSSPGEFTIDGAFVAAAGSRMILEVADNGSGGFVTDHVRFNGSADFGSLQIEFRFLGDTDPNAFQASGGFAIDTFLQQSNGAGGWGGVALEALGGVTFSARADAYTFSSFAFSAVDGATFMAVAVPEVGTWLQMAAGLLGLGWSIRRRASAA